MLAALLGCVLVTTSCDFSSGDKVCGDLTAHQDVSGTADLGPLEEDAQAGPDGSDDTTVDGSASPTGEYGDAPDEQPTFYRAVGAASMGSFPSLFATGNCRVESDGHGAHATTSELLLGDGASAEAGIRDRDDEDGTANEIDDDLFDDGLVAFWSLESGVLALRVVLTNGGAASATGYLNVLADLDQDGEWSDTGSNMEEWVLQNEAVTLEAGESVLLTIDEIASPATPFQAWIRLTFTDSMVVSFEGDWDGCGAFDDGEVEDYLISVDRAAAFEYADDSAADFAADMANQWQEASAFAVSQVDIFADAFEVTGAEVSAWASAAAEASASAFAEAEAASTAAAEANASAEAAAEASAEAWAEAAAATESASTAADEAAASAAASATSECASVSASADAFATAISEAAADAEAEASALAFADAYADAIAAADALAEAGASGGFASAEASAAADALADAIADTFALASATAEVVAEVVTEASIYAEAYVEATAFWSATYEAQWNAQSSFQWSNSWNTATQTAWNSSANWATSTNTMYDSASNAAASASALAEAAANASAQASAFVDPDCKGEICVEVGVELTDCLDDLDNCQQGTCEADLAAVQGELDAANNTISQLEADLVDALLALSDCNDEKDQLQAGLDICGQDLEAATTELDNLSMALDQCGQDLQAAQQDAQMYGDLLFCALEICPQAAEVCGVPFGL